MVATSSRVLAGIGRFTQSYPKLSKAMKVGMIAAAGVAAGAADRAASFNRFDVHPESLALSVSGGLAAALLAMRSMRRQIKLATMEVGNINASDRERWMIKDIEIKFNGRKIVQTYLISEAYGEGGCATVRLAVNLSQGNRLEIFKLAKYLDKESRDRFIRESEMLMRFNHSNVVTCFGQGELSGIPFYSMEFVGGASLADLLGKFKQVHPLEATRMMIEIAEVFKAVHQVGIYHRDIKPDNILLARNGTIKLIDFGIAKDTKAEHRMTQTGAVFGTPEYMAPEQHFPHMGPVDNRTDIYALGVLYYNLLTGQPPFPSSVNLATGTEESYGEYIHRYIDAITNSKIPDVAPLVPELNRRVMRDVLGNLRGVLQKALMYKKQERYLNVDQFIADLKVVESSIERANVTPMPGSVK
ncbi:MAG: serine/threonine-protein kinase [Candidatus Margulisiibacteriota bacterium]|jgi:serine/threonine protein kinase